MKKLLSILGATSILSSSAIIAVSCTTLPINPGPELEEMYKVKSQSIKNQDWQKVLKTNYSSHNKTLPLRLSGEQNNDLSTLANKNVINIEDKLLFTPYADMGIIEDTAELLMKDKGKSQATRDKAAESLQNNLVYNDLGEIAGDSEVITQDTEITLGFMQNASDTGALVPMWNAAPAQGGKGVIEQNPRNEKEYAKWFNDRYRNWTSKSQSNRWVGNANSGNLSTEQVRISFGPFANSLWHSAWQNNKTPEELADILALVAMQYQTKKFDFYFAAPYLSKSGAYADSQRLLASALKILIERDHEYDVQLSLVMSSDDGIAINQGFFSDNNPNERGNLILLGDEAFPLYNFTKYLGMNYRLNLVTGYTDTTGQTGSNWEVKQIQKGTEKTIKNWKKMHEVINGETVLSDHEVSRRTKVTPWIGRRAENPKYNLTPQNVVELRSWAEKANLGGLGMFYISRDNPSLFMPNSQTTGDLNPLDQNIRSGSGFASFTYAKALNGILKDASSIPNEALTKEAIKDLGGVDYNDDIKNNIALDNEEIGGGEWEGPITDPGAGGAEGAIPIPPPAGVGASLYNDWASANPNRSLTINEQQANNDVYFSPYLDAGLYSGNDVAQIMQETQLDHLTLAFVQQVNEISDHMELSIAGQAKNNSSYEWWEQTQLWEKMLKPLVDANKFANLKIAYGGATTGGFTEKNPWTLANKLNPNDPQSAKKMLKEALVGYQQEMADVVNKYGKQKADIDMPKNIDFDIEGHAQNLDEDNRLLAATIAELKKEDKSWDFSLTLPVLPDGLTSVGQNVLNIFVSAFLAEGLTIEDLPKINLMLMDYGDPIYVNARDNQKITNFDLAKQAIEATKNNLDDAVSAIKVGEIIEEKSLYNLIGATPMIGVNDTVHGVFSLEDAKELYNWAQEKQLAYLSMWSMNDDRGLDIQSGLPINKSLTSHGLAYLREYDFAKAFIGLWDEEIKYPKTAPKK